MQTDGNLVVYRHHKPLWDTGTYGHPGAAFALWGNGALFIADSTELLWGVGRGPASGVFPQQVASGSTWLTSGTGLFDGQNVIAGQYLLAMQTDGNLVVYIRGGRPLWSTGTFGRPGDWLIMQSDGNLVIYDVQGYAIWASGTPGHPGGFAVMQTDANFVVYSSSDQPLWASNSEQVGTYSDPLRSVQSLIAERIDQGVDYSGNGTV
jgi:hypothetical protein